MNSNSNNSPNPNNYPVNNYSNNNWNNYQNDPYMNSYHNQNDATMGKRLAKSCRTISIVYLCLFLFEIIFCVLSCVYFARFIYELTENSMSSTQVNDDSIIYLWMNDFCTFLIMIGITGVLGLVIFVLGIILIVKTNTLNNYYYGNSILWILFLIGIFSIIPGIVAGFMTISTCNKILKSENNYNSPNSYNGY